MIRMVCDSSEKAISFAEGKILELRQTADDIVYIFDAYHRIDSERYDALILSARSGISPLSRFVMALPYAWSGKENFRIYKPKVIEWKACEDFDMNRAIELFWHGVDSHDIGSKVWEKHLDQTK